MNEISIGKRSPNANSGVNSWAPIKPSLHVIKSSVMSKKLSQKVELSQRNSHLLPFKVNHNQLMPHLSQLSSFTSIDNHLNESKDKELETKDNNYVNNSEMRQNCCPQNQWFETQNNFNSNYGLNSLQLDYNYEKEDKHKSRRQLRQSPIQSNGIQYINKTNLMSNSSSPKTSLSLTSNVTQRYCQSCPSSPLMKRSQTDVKPIHSTNVSLCFHKMHGSDIHLNEDLTEAQRYDCVKVMPNCYAFISEQIQIGLKITIEITSLEVLNGSKESFIFGLTNANPSKLNDLPNNPQELVQRKDQFWTLVDSFCDYCNLNDKLSFVVDSKGFVRFWINSSPHTILFSIKNPNQNLWAFFNLIGRIKAIKLVNTTGILNRKDNYSKNASRLSYFNRNSVSHLYKCINCFSNYADTAFYKCGHKYYCFHCARLHFNTTNKCPFCFQIIYDLLVIFP